MASYPVSHVPCLIPTSCCEPPPIAYRFCEEDIDQILEHRAHVIQLKSEAISTFGQGCTLEYQYKTYIADYNFALCVPSPSHPMEIQ